MVFLDAVLAADPYPVLEEVIWFPISPLVILNGQKAGSR